MQWEMLPGYVQSGPFLHRSKGWEHGWGLAGQEGKRGGKPTEDAVVSVL